ncbi:MAG TPA: Lrp/AsnC family transcriptional regulator [Nocardioides sp.]|nr:Lrp/AsnC family transcriptional regulator [Nocardioides sp.]
MTPALDLLDLSILKLCLERPKAGVREYARVLGAARGTVQSRLDRMARLGVITGYEPGISPAGLGYAALAYVRLNLAQGVLDEVTQRLTQIPEVIQVDSIAGDSDLLCHVVSTGPENTEEVIQQIIAVPGVIRSRTETVLRRRVPHRVRPLIERLVEEATAPPTPRKKQG